MVTSVALYLGFLGLVALERGGELLLSRRNARQARAAGAVESGRGHYPVMVAFHTLFLVSCAAEVLLVPRSFPGAVGWAALGAALLAQGLRYWAVASLGSALEYPGPGLAGASSGDVRALSLPSPPQLPGGGG